MYSIVDLCFMCLTNNKNIKSILSHDSEGTVIEDKCRFLLNEHVPIKPEVSFICLHCLNNLNYAYKFKQMCLQNIHKFNNYVDSSGTNKHLKVTLTDTVFQKENKLTWDNDNESANKISPSFEVVSVKEEIANNSEIKEDSVSEEEKRMHQDEFSRKENPEDINHDSKMQYTSNLCEDSHIEHFLKKVKMETGFEIVHEEFHVKDEQLFEPTDSASQDNSNDKLQNDAANNPENISTSSSYSESNETSNNSTQFDKKPTKSHKCDVCNKACSTPSMLVRHKRIHTGERPYKCDVCEKSFSLSHQLVRHKRIHTGERPYECVVCQKSFSQSIQLVLHKRTHTGERPYECDVCQKSFIDATKLVRHKRGHTGEKPYECDLCLKSFSKSSRLVQHKRIHTGERPYECDVCQKSFHQSANLVRHKRIHSGERPYECVVCQKSFRQSIQLVLHESIHTGK